MALQDALGYDGKTYSGQEFRLLVAALSGGQSGVSTPADMKAVPQGSPNATVSVPAGTAIIPATHAGDLGSYEVPNDAALTSPAVAATGANPRWDLLILEVIAGVPQLTIVQGTPAGSPSYPSLAAHDNYIVIAGIKMPASKSIIDNGSNGTIEDRRGYWRSYQVCSSTTRPPIPYDGQMIEETDTEQVYIWDAGNNQWAPSRLYIGTAASLPAAPKQGTPAYVTDANLPSGAVIPDATSRPPAPGLYVFDQRWDPPWNMPWGVMGYKEVTADQGTITTIVDLTSLTLTITARANRRWEIIVEGLVTSSVVADLIVGYITDGSNVVKNRWAQVIQVGTGGQGQKQRGSANVVTVGGSVTYKARLERNAGTGNVTLQANAAYAASIKIIDHGPAGQPA